MMPSNLKCDAINLNDYATIKHLIEVLTNLVHDKTNHHLLNVRGIYHFTTPNGPITSDAGWYIIYDEAKHPLYVGTATNLNNRLNTDNGSRDNFANPKRTSDDARNFIKSFVLQGIVQALFVSVIPESALCVQMGIQSPLSKQDRENVEKVLGIFRAKVMKG